MIFPYMDGSICQVLGSDHALWSQVLTLTGSPSHVDQRQSSGGKGESLSRKTHFQQPNFPQWTHQRHAPACVLQPPFSCAKWRVQPMVADVKTYDLRTIIYTHEWRRYSHCPVDERTKCMNSCCLFRKRNIDMNPSNDLLQFSRNWLNWTPMPPVRTHCVTSSNVSRTDVRLEEDRRQYWIAHSDFCRNLAPWVATSPSFNFPRTLLSRGTIYGVSRTTNRG